MAKRTPQMTSKDALNNFKSKISESLPLLGFLNNEDKVDIWKYWKTVSSAVKIAVNGKGDIVETPRRNYKIHKCARERQLEEYRLQHLDRQAITIYAPVKCVDKGLKKFRVLKIANQKKISDFYETMPVLEDDDSETPIPDVNLENFDFSELGKVNLFEENKSEFNLPDKILPANHGSNETLKTVTNNFKSNEAVIPCQDTNSNEDSLFCTESDCGPNKPNKAKPVKKIWPVGRPTTRSLGARVIKDTFSDREDSKTVLRGNTCDSVDVNCVNFYQSVKEEVSEKVDSEFNITLVRMGKNVLPVSQGTLSDLHEQLHNSQDIINQELTSPLNSPQVVGHSVDSEELLYHQSKIRNSSSPDYQMQVILPEEVSQNDTPLLENDKSIYVASEQILKQEDESQSIAVYSSGEPKNDESVALQCNLTPRNASDIETIISALEEELKKTNPSVVSVTHNKVHTQEDELSVSDVKDSYDEAQVQTVQILEGEEIVEVQHFGNVIWTNDGEVQILGSTHVVDSSADGAVIYEEQPLEGQYDVVEYEVLDDKKLKRGRKKKLKEENNGAKSEIVDRTCPICHRVLNYASSMTAHMRIHTGVRPYSCGQCDRKFTTKANRDRHEATHVGLKPFQCSHCSKSFTEKRSLKIHMRTHTGERPFVCNVCNRGFTQKCTLLVHMDRHTNKKGHLCDLCGKAFRQKCQLDVHVKRHKRQASFPCNECSTKCYTKGDLMRHMIKHTGERPFQCKLCHRAFTRKQYLIDHENQHYGRKPYRCSVCSATFHDMGSCHRHLRKHKQDEEGENGEGSTKSALLSSTDFHRILEGKKIGQIIKLDNGTEALVKAVTTEADGNTVYHISYLNKSLSQPGSNEEATMEDVCNDASN